MSAMTNDRLVLTNANVIDCVGERPIVGGSVVIERGRIGDVLDGSRSPDLRHADVIDLDGMYLLPGLWDVHIHPDYLAGVSAVDQTIAFGHRLMEALTEAGVVAVRYAGAAHFMDVAWKRIRGGSIRGSACVRRRPLLDDHGRSFPDVGTCARVRRPVRLCPRDPGADQEWRRSHQAEPHGRHHGSALGPPLAFIPPRRRIGGGVRDW